MPRLDLYLIRLLARGPRMREHGALLAAQRESSWFGEVK